MVSKRARTIYGFLGILVVVALVITGWGPTPATPAPNPTPTPVKIVGKLRVGIYAYMTQGIDFNKTVSKYTAANKDVQIEVIPIPGEESAWNVVAQKMQLEAQQKKSSWDILIGVTPFVEPGALAKLGVIDPLEDLIAKRVWDDVYTGILKEMRYTGDNKIYTFPWWSDVFGTIYRPSMLKEATGSETPPATWDAILATAEKIKAKYGDKVAGFGADWNWLHRSFLPIFSTLTDKVYTADGVVNLDDPTAKETLELLKKLYAYMPAASAESLGSSKAFQAGALAVEIYWQPQLLRAIQAKQPKADIKMATFPKGKRESTIFWTAGAVLPKFSENKPAAVDFMLKALLDMDTVEMSQVGNWKIVPFKSIQKKLQDAGKQPAWAPPLLALLDVAPPIPCNQYFLTVEQPIYKEEIEKMLLKGQSVADTLKNLKERITKGVAEVK